MSPFASTCAGLEAMIEIARKRGDVAIASTLEGYLEGIRRMGGWGAEVSATMPTATRKPKVQSAESAPMTPAERARAYRQRHANRHGGVTKTVTSSVTDRDDSRDDSRDVLRDASRLAGAPSLSLISEEEGNKAEETERETQAEEQEILSGTPGVRESVTRDASRPVTSRPVTSRPVTSGRPSRHGVTEEHPSGDLTPAPWAAAIVDSIRLATGRSPANDLAVVWAHFVAHLGTVDRPVTRREWSKWCAQEVKRDARASAPTPVNGLVRPRSRARDLQPYDPDAPWLKDGPQAPYEPMTADEAREIADVITGDPR